MVGRFAQILKEVLTDIAREYRFKIIAQEIMPDHVHLLLEAPPKYAPAKVVGILKGKSSSIMRREFLDEIRKYIWKENTLWARGYYIATVGNSITTEIVKEYIENQKSKKESLSGEGQSQVEQLRLFDG